jgi:hypothetical protein
VTRANIHEVTILYARKHLLQDPLVLADFALVLRPTHLLGSGDLKVPRERKLTATAILEEEGDHPSTMDHDNGLQHYSNHHCRNKNCSDAFDSHAEIPEG